MTLLPVIERELRAQARASFTYWLRMTGVALVLLAAFFFGLSRGFDHDQGGRLFGYLNFALFCSIWIFVPLVVADCISFEKREGTLGLLFLTPLRAGDIVLAKGFVHGLRALTLWVAVVPVLMIPVLLGGVTWKEAVLSVMANFGSICWALAAGLLASAIGKQWLRSVLLAYALAALFMVGFFYLNGMGLMLASGPSRHAYLLSSEELSDQILQTGFVAATDILGYWGQIFSTIPAAGQMSWLFNASMVALVSLMALVAACGIAAGRVRKTWQELPPRPWVLWLEKKLCTPIILVAYLRRWTRRKLERNPIGWLGQRTWSGRLVTWGWFAVMVSFYTAAFTNGNERVYASLQQFMAQLLIGSLAVSAAGSFRRERETGVLELLLVSPLREGQIIGGRLRGLWGQFLPALVLLVGVWLYVPELIFAGRGVRHIPFYLTSFATLPVIGLYFSLRQNNFITAFALTMLLGVLLPMWLCEWIGFAIDFEFPGLRFAPQPQLPEGILFFLLRLAGSSLTTYLFQFLFAGWAARQLYCNLTRRDFAFVQAATRLA